MRRRPSYRGPALVPFISPPSACPPDQPTVRYWEWLTDNQTYNHLITALRAPAERANALLGRWRALRRVTVSPQRISAIAAAALVLTSLDRGIRGETSVTLLLGWR